MIRTRAALAALAALAPLAHAASAEPARARPLAAAGAILETGPIVSMPLGRAPAAARPDGEAVLLLPRRSDGTLAGGWSLGEGVTLAASAWSPLLCSTLARLVADPALPLDRYVEGLPEGAALVRNDVYATATSRVAAPSDPYRALQHGLDRLGVEAAGGARAGAGVRVALLDSAPDAGHRDLAGLRVLALEGGPGTEPALHGSLTAGVIAAVAGNGYGIAGVAPGAEVFAVAVCAPSGPGRDGSHASAASVRDSCRLYDLLRGMDLAVAERAQVLNLSFAGPPNPLLERAARRLDALGVLAVAAAGDEGGEAPRYPAAYPSVVGVGALDTSGRPSPLSNRGPAAEIWAPGSGVLSTAPGDAFAWASGSSVAAAHVSGALAVLIGRGAAPDEARRALFHAAQVASRGAPPALAPVCDALARLGTRCAR